MITEIALRKKAVQLDLQGTKKTEIARRLEKNATMGTTLGEQI